MPIETCNGRRQPGYLNVRYVGDQEAACSQNYKVKDLLLGILCMR